MVNRWTAEAGIIPSQIIVVACMIIFFCKVKSSRSRATSKGANFLIAFQSGGNEETGRGVACAALALHLPGDYFCSHTWNIHWVGGSTGSPPCGVDCYLFLCMYFGWLEAVEPALAPNKKNARRKRNCCRLSALGNFHWHTCTPCNEAKGMQAAGDKLWFLFLRSVFGSSPKYNTAIYSCPGKHSVLWAAWPASHCMHCMFFHRLLTLLTWNFHSVGFYLLVK